MFLYAKTIVAINAIAFFVLIYYKSIGFIIFDVLANMYTFARLKYELYDPFKPKLMIHRISHYCKVPEGKLYRHSDRELASLLKQIEQLPIESEHIALSIVYSFSDWNQKFIKLIPLKTKVNLKTQDLTTIFSEELPNYNEYNYDYHVDILSNSFKQVDLPIVKANLEAYLRRTPTFEAEQALEALKSEPGLMEFISDNIDSARTKIAGYQELSDNSNLSLENVKKSQELGGLSESSDGSKPQTIEELYRNGYCSFLATDELGSEYFIGNPIVQS